MDTKFSMALHIMIYIAETKRIPSSEALAQSVNTNSSHIRKITSGLKRARLIESSQGKTGFYLAKRKEEITLADIYTSVYSQKDLIHIHENANEECPIGVHIRELLTPVFDEAEQAFLDKLREVTLEQLIKNLYTLGER